MPPLPADLRLLLAHKQKTSGRLRFLRFPHGMCAFDPLPRLSVLEDEALSGRVSHHPSAWLRTAAARLGMDAEALEAEAQFSATVQTPQGSVAIQLASFATVDPPFAEAEALGGRFVAITDTRDCSPVDMELLRRAYAVYLG